MISSVLSNGEFLSLIIDNTCNSQKFWDFLSILRYTLKFIKMNAFNKYVYVMDNASIHHSLTTTNNFKRLNIFVVYLPPYSPELAPIELFFRLVKNKIRGSENKKEYSFSNQKERMVIFQSIKNTHQISILKMWNEFLTKAKNWILKNT